MTHSYDYDFLVIGAGSGGVRASRIAASHGARTAVVEHQALGGTCVNVGCVPKKLFVIASHFGELFEASKGYGWQPGEPTFNWQTLLQNKNKEIERLNGIYENLLAKAGVDILHGYARFKDEHTVQIDEQDITAEKILIAVGGHPTVPDFPGKEHVVTSNELFYLDKLPEKIIIVGGGYIAVEFAGIFNGLGVDTTLIYRRELPLRGFDEDIRAHLATEMQQRGIKLLSEQNIAKVEKDNGFTATLLDGSTLQADLIAYATGRAANTQNLGLENINVETKDSGAISINDDYQTSVPNIYAIGDVTDRIQLTPVAIKEGHVLADNLFNKQSRHISYDDVPTAIFSQPPIATVGLTEAEASAQGHAVKVYSSSFRPMINTLGGSQSKTLMKLVVDEKSDKVLGLQMIGDEAAEIVQGFAVALKAGATKATFNATIGIHPSSAEEFVTMR